jgi:DNA (cytosine-5)-methyltransferase 1
MIKVLNLYAGIGGNRKLWENVEVTALEDNPKIAAIYKDLFPNDKVIVRDAHEYLLKHFREFDFIWASPPCPTHSKLRTMQKEIVYPDMTLYQEIILLRSWFKGFWVVENVEPYYATAITPNFVMHRHFFWCNFWITQKDFEQLETCKKLGEREFLQSQFGFNLDNYTGIDKRKALRNCVVPELGKHIFDCAFNGVSQALFEVPQMKQKGL